jgi:hypothetical protein
VRYVRPPVDAHESDRVEWVPLDDVPRLITEGDIRAAHTVAALLTLRQMRNDVPATSTLSTHNVPLTPAVGDPGAAATCPGE